MNVVARAFFGFALCCCPPGFRREYGRAMRDDFSSALREEHAMHGVVGASVYAASAVTDLFITALREYAAMLFRDFVYALRALRKTPSFTAVVVATLALAIGANASVFSILRTVVLAPLPYSDPGRLIAMTSSLHGKDLSVSLPDFADAMKENGATFATAAAFRAQRLTLTGRGTPAALAAIESTPQLFSTLGIRPEIGRFPGAGEARKGVASVAVISDGLWRGTFAADPAVIGSIVRLSGEAYHLIGVTPPDFVQPRNGSGFQAADVWTFLPEDGAGTEFQRGYHAFGTIERLRPGASVESARAVTAGTASRLARRYPDDDTQLTFGVMSLEDSLVGNVRALLFAVFAAVGAVLLVACANVANLLLSRAASREREFSVRIAIGASRGRIIAQLLVETFVLASAGGAIGIGIAYGTVAAFVAFHPANIPRADLVSVDVISIAYTLGIVAFCTVAAGLAPAFASSQRDVALALKSAGRGGDGSRGGRARSMLVASEIAMTLALVVAAGLVLRSYVALTSQPLGFVATGVTIVGDYDFPDLRYGTDAALGAFMTRALEKARTVPGVADVAWAYPVPYTGTGFGTSFGIRGQVVRAGYEPSSQLAPVSEGFFHVLGAAQVAGREFRSSDRMGSLRVAIVNESFAKRYFPGESALGKQVAPGIRLSSDKTDPYRTIVGVVGDMRQSFSRPVDPTIYVPSQQFPLSGSSLIVKALPGANPASGVAAAVAPLDPQLARPKITPLATLLAQNVEVKRLSVYSLSLLALVALALSVAGVFAVVSYGVTQRTHEFGIRMALGADARQIVRTVLAGAMRLAFAGIVLGLFVAAAGTHFLADQLYDTQPLDPLTFGTVTAFVIVAALLAALVPARRATRVDPIVALRYE